jgi:cystathionine gamma-synthase
MNDDKTPPNDTLATRCVHAGGTSDPSTGAIAPPLHLTTTFERAVDGGYPHGYRYSREGTPNRDTLERCIADLEGGLSAFAFSSGLAASLAVFELLRAGDHVVAPREGYHGTLNQLRTIIAGRGITVDLIDTTQPAAIEAALARPTRLLWLETPANPLLSITDIEHAVSVAHRNGALVACDNTFATPVCQRPLDLGADLVVHSGTKYLGGHSDVLSGLVVVRSDAELAQRLGSWQTLAGSVLAPFDCWLLRRSIVTLALRVRQQCASAAELAAKLSTHPHVERMLYPGLQDHPGHRTAARQMTGGFGAMLALCVRGGRDAAMTVASRTRLFRRATSLGGTESLIEHRASIEGPASTTPQNLLRLSIGIEDVADLEADLRAALG